MLGLSGRQWVERVMAVAAVGTLLATAGCGAFFQCEGKTSCGTSSTSSTNDVVFVAGQGSTSLYAYSLTTSGTNAGALTAVSGSPYALPYAPTSMVLTPDDSLLYVSTGAGIYSYPVNTSTGALSSVTTQGTVAVPSVSMVISPNAKWLFALDAVNSVNTQLYLREYAIGAGGALSTSTTAGATGITLGNASAVSQTITPAQVTISADGNYIAVALGAAGVQFFPFNQTTGVVTTGQAANQLSANSATVADNTVAFDSFDNLYFARTTGTTGTGLLVYSISTATYLASGTTPIVTGQGPRSLLFADNYAYLYTANKADSTITPLSVTSSAAAVTPKIITTDIAAPSLVQALAVDRTGNYVFSAGINSTGLEVFSIGSSGTLTAGKTAQSSTVSGYAPLLVATH